MRVVTFAMCVGLAALALSACQRARAPADEVMDAPEIQPATPRALEPFQFVDEDAGIALSPVAGFTLRRDFVRSYMSRSTWKAFAGTDQRGTPLAALVLDGSDRITAAELRIGTSTDRHAVTGCLDAPAGAIAGGPEQARIDGQPFRHFRVRDAATGHYRWTEAYRAVRDDRCIAIDLLVAGTRPELYDPPATPPFQADAALARLQEALGAVHILR